MKIIIYILTIIFILSCSFDPKVNTQIECLFEIENRNHETLYVFISNYDSLRINSKTVSNSDELFTSDITYDEFDTLSHQKYRLIPKETTYFYGNKKWMPYKNTNCIYIYFINERNLKRYKWEEVEKKQLYEKKIRLTFDRIENKHLKLIYK